MPKARAYVALFFPMPLGYEPANGAQETWHKREKRIFSEKHIPINYSGLLKTIMTYKT